MSIEEQTDPKVSILILDIETAPNLAYVWKFFKANISPKQVLEDCSIMSWSAKWLGDDKTAFMSGNRATEKEMLEALVVFLDEADIVVGHNVSGFDMPKIRGRCLVHDIPLPSPYKEIDTYRIARKEFGFDRNSLEYLAEVLGVGMKGTHGNFPGFELWKACLAGDKKAWKEMEEYNRLDVDITEKVYLALRPYTTNHPNLGVFIESEELICPKCGSDSNERRGFAYTNTGKFQRYQCRTCGGWHRSRYTEYPIEKKKALAANAVS